MKNTFLFFLLVLLGTTTAKAQTDFAPIGAEWYYGSTVPHVNYPHYAHYLVTKDTVIQGKSCRKIEGTYYPGKQGPFYDDPIFPSTAEQYIYTNADTVFYYNDFFSSFLPLYIFNVQTGDTVFYHAPVIDSGSGLTDTFFRVVIENVDTLMVDNIPLRRIWTKSLDWWYFDRGHYIERIGSTFYMIGHSVFYLPLTLTDRAIRCYKDNDIFYKYGSIDCEYLPTNITDVNNSEEKAFDIYPNPSNGNFMINTGSVYPDQGKIIITDLSGRKIHHLLIIKNGQDVHGYSLSLPVGIYILTYTVNSIAYAAKLVIQPK